MRSLRERLEAMQPPPVTRTPVEPAGVPIEQIAPGTERTNAHGSFYLIDETLPDPTNGQFAERSDVLPASLPSGATRSGQFGAGDLLFLDTETTGLDRGTGTHVFLTGVGYFDGRDFRVQQFFIRDLYEEASLLHDFVRLLGSFPVVVSFNGRAFDWPMLYNRFILHGYRELPEFIHWDLLTSSRRVWRPRLKDCSLGNLERNLLGVRRFGDVPGFLIPQIYFDYLRTRDASPLRPVFNHNQEDVVSLARLADLLLATETEPARTLVHGTDRLAWGLHLLGSGNIERAEPLILPNLDEPAADPELRARAYRALAACYRRNGRRVDAAAVWERMARQRWDDPEVTVFALTELAKYFEHHERDFDAAIGHTERALNIAELHGLFQNWRSLSHRFARLISKSQRSRATGDKPYDNFQGD